MTYSPETGSYQNDFLEKILDTDYRYNQPYKIDKDKYNEVIKKYKMSSTIFDADVITLMSDYYGDDEDSCSYTLFAWPENSPESSNDHYDCFQFYRYDYESQKAVFEEFVHEIVGCIIEPDKECVKKLIDKIVGEITEREGYLALLYRTK